MADHRQVSRQYKHRRGQAVTHLGRRRHGADDISEGHRVNLIMWNYNSAYRASKSYAAQWYEVEARSPDPRCVSYTHDRDWEALTGERLEYDANPWPSLAMEPNASSSNSMLALVQPTVVDCVDAK